MNRSRLSRQINREQIDSLKNDTQSFLSFLHGQKDGTIVYVLEKLGKLENGNSKQPLLNLLDNNNDTIRLLAIKNLAKIKDPSLLDDFARLARQDKSTKVRRESISAIGRLRDPQNIPLLIELLSDKDPKVVMQAIRGLLVFPTGKRISKAFAQLLNHPNELIQEMIHKALNGTSHGASAHGKHNEFPSYLKNTVVQGDVIKILKYVHDGSIHLTFTSPPYYNARDYSIYQSYDEYLRFLKKAFKEVHRITKEGRFFILNTSPIIIPRISRTHSSKRYPIPYDIHPLLIQIGWEFIDDIVWIKPETSVKNRNAGFMQHRKPLSYKPNTVTEMLMVYRKKTDRLIDWNIRQYDRRKVQKSKVMDKYETTNVWRIEPAFDRIHSAVFPIELCDRVIRYYSFVDDLVFDPFAGRGTLGKAAFRLGRYFFLTEKEPQYVHRIQEDLTRVSSLFSPRETEAKFVDAKEFISLATDQP